MTTTETHPIMQAAIAKAKADIAKAERQAAITLAATNLVPIAPKTVVIQAKEPWICYMGTSYQTALDILAAYEPYRLPFIDYKGTFRSQACKATYKPKEGEEIMGEYALHLNIDARCPEYISYSQRARIGFYADIPEIGIAAVHIDFSVHYFDNTPYPTEWLCTFGSDRGTGRYRHIEYWSKPAPMHCDARIQYATGADRPGMARNDVLLYRDAETIVSFLMSKIEG